MAIKVSYRIKKSEYEIIVQNCLEKILAENDISKYYYNLTGYSEDKICLERRRSNWITYYGDHGKKVDIKVYPNIKDAALGIIGELSENEHEGKKIASQLRASVNQSVRINHHSTKCAPPSLPPFTNSGLYLSPFFNFDRSFRRHGHVYATLAVRKPRRKLTFAISQKAGRRHKSAFSTKQIKKHR